MSRLALEILNPLSIGSGSNCGCSGREAQPSCVSHCDICMLDGCLNGSPITLAAVLTSLRSCFCSHKAPVRHVEIFLSLSVLLLKVLKVHLELKLIRSSWLKVNVKYVESLLQNSYTTNDQISQNCRMMMMMKRCFVFKTSKVAFTVGGQCISVIVIERHNIDCIILSTMQ